MSPRGPGRAPHHRLDRAYPALFAALLAAAAALALAYRYPPLVDWPEHLAQDAIVAHLRDPAWSTGRHYVTTGWFVPYQGFRWLHIALATVLGDGLAGRAVLALYLVATPLAAAALVRRMGLDRWVALGTFAILVEGNFLWGFAPHALGTALALGGLVLGLDFAREGRTWRAAALALLGVALFFTHAQQTAVWIASTAVLALVARAARVVSWRRTAALLGTLVPATVLLLAYLLGAGWISGAVLRDEFAIRGGVQWHSPWDVARLFFYSAGLTLMGPWLLLAWLAALAAVAMGAWASARHRGDPPPRPPSLAPWPFAGPALCALWLLFAFALPAVYRGQSIAPRFASLALLAALWTLPMRAPRTAREARALAPARVTLALAALAALGAAHASFARFARSMRPLDAALARIPRGSRVATLVYQQHPEGYRLPVYLHVGGYVVAARGGMVSQGFTRTGVTYAPAVPRAALTVRELWAPSLRGWQLDPARHAGFYDYVLVRTGPRYPGTPFSGSAPGVRCERVFSEGGFELWRIVRS